MTQTKMANYHFNDEPHGVFVMVVHGEMMVGNESQDISE